MLIIILASVLIIGAIIGNIKFTKKDRKPTTDPLMVNTPTIGEPIKEVETVVSHTIVSVVEPVKKQVSKNTAKQKPLAKMEAKPKKKAQVIDKSSKKGKE